MRRSEVATFITVGLWGLQCFVMIPNSLHWRLGFIGNQGWWRRSYRDLRRPGCPYHPSPKSPSRGDIHLIVRGRSGCHASCDGMGHHQPHRVCTHYLRRQPVASQGSWTSVSSDPPFKNPPKRSSGPDKPPVVTRAQSNTRQLTRRHRSQNSQSTFSWHNNGVKEAAWSKIHFFMVKEYSSPFWNAISLSRPATRI